MSEPVRKIIVAIHGIGSQRRSDTIRSVARRFGARSAPPLPVMPLGHFHIGKDGEVHVSRLDAPDDSPLRQIGFAEVFWADIPRQVVRADDTLEETKAWGASVVSRARARYTEKVQGERSLTHADFELGSAVIEEIVETVGVLENLFTVTAKLGIFKFDLGPLLRDYIDDVQLVTDFQFYRRRIVSRFHGAMAQIVERYRQQYPGESPEIHIVAHSEGTVVSFLGLLEALSDMQIFDPDTNQPISTEWISCVRGYMTIGSPIDKHIILWPKLWEWQGMDLNARRPDQPIAWRNYYDYGDPIGFRLESAAVHLERHGCEAFDFKSTPGKDDFGFSRYLLPGKAHNDYWGDADVFGHFIDDVVLPDPKRPAMPPANRPGFGAVSTAIPYLLSMALHVAGVFLLYKGVTAFFGGGQRAGDMMLSVVLLALLLAGVTVAARLPHLVKTSGARWHLAALAVFAVAAIPTVKWLPREIGDFLGAKLPGLFAGSGSNAGVYSLVAIATLIAVSGWLSRSHPRAARRGLIGCGAALVLGIVAIRIWAAQSDQSQWPVFLAGAVFLYLWWLGMLLFDLAFVWHRYVRNAVGVETLNEWNRGRDAQPKVSLRRKKQPPAAAPDLGATAPG
jgi:hypothetical protein